MDGVLLSVYFNLDRWRMNFLPVSSECLICLSPLENKSRFMGKCGHEIHSKCLRILAVTISAERMLTCPMCRSDWSEDKPLIEGKLFEKVSYKLRIKCTHGDEMLVHPPCEKEMQIKPDGRYKITTKCTDVSLVKEESGDIFEIHSHQSKKQIHRYFR